MGGGRGMKTTHLPRFVVAIFAGSMMVVLSGVSASAQKNLHGIALVIGQSAYEHIPELANPANDAREMVKLLTDLGFDASSVTDRDARRLRRDLERFVEDAAEADVALLYYAGHGIEAGGENWLVPVDADHGALDSASEMLVALSAVLEELKRTVPVTIVLMDACRTNPFPPNLLLHPAPGKPGVAMGAGGLTAMRGATPLTAPMPANDNLGLVIGFAAEPGMPALDGEVGGNSPYAAALLRHLAALPGVEFGSVMRMITEEVYLSTGTRQRPWVNESLRRQLFFGIAPEEPAGEEGLITGERRQLLLTIADLPDLNRVQVEQVAARDGVPLDALYGVLRALDETARPDNPEDLARMLDAQAQRLQKMLAERVALRTDDPELLRLSQAADRAIAEGAIQTARLFMDEAVARIEETASEVDDLEERLREKRLADAAIYARRADAASLAFAFRDAAADYDKAFELVERWDDKLAWNYRNLQAESLRTYGEARGERVSLDEAIGVYEAILDMVSGPTADNDRAIVMNNMAVVLNTIGEMATGGDELHRAMAMFEEAKAVFEKSGDRLNLAAAENNIGNILLVLGQREASAARLEQALAAFRSALELRDRATVPFDWATTQNNIGIAAFSLSERSERMEPLQDAEAAYRAALEVLTQTANPLEWAMVQNNLGNTLNARGLRANDVDLHAQALAAYDAALQVRTREEWPRDWAATQLNIGNAYSHMARHEAGLDSIGLARDASRRSLEVFGKETAPLDWASAQNNLGSALQTIGQRSGDVTMLDASIDAFEQARGVYRRAAFPLDWAMTYHNAANTLMLKGGVTNEPKHYRDAIVSFKRALGEFTREVIPLQWAMTMSSLGSALQAMSGHETGLARLREAIDARRAALEVLALDNAPVEWANAQNGLGTCLLNLSTREGTPEPLEEARAAFEAAKQVFTRETQPVQWAFLENNIGDVHWNLAAMGGGEPDYRRAIALFESAKTGFSEGGHAAIIDLTDRKIALIREQLAQQ